MEYELLKFFLTHPGKVFTREQLLSRVWGYEYYGGARTVDVHVRRLRAKLGEEHANLIQTVRSVGYRFGQTRWPGAGGASTASGHRGLSRPERRRAASPSAALGVVRRATSRTGPTRSRADDEQPDRRRRRTSNEQQEHRSGHRQSIDRAHRCICWSTCRGRPRLRSLPAAPAGSAATCTVERAGWWSPKASAYTALTVAKSAMSVTNTVVLATSVIDAPQSPSTAVDVGEHLARLRLDAAVDHRAGRGVEADLAREHEPVAGAHRGRVRTGDRRRARRRDGFDGHRYLLSRRAARVCRAGNVSGRSPSARVSAFHAAAATAANTASDEPRERLAVVVDDRRRRRAACPSARTMPNERIVRSCTSPVSGSTDERLGAHPAQRHVRGADHVGAQHDLVERIAGRDAHLDASSAPVSAIDVHARAALAPDGTRTHVSSSADRR